VCVCARARDMRQFCAMGSCMVRECSSWENGRHNTRDMENSNLTTVHIIIVCVCVCVSSCMHVSVMECAYALTHTHTRTQT
jgi:hypothetical protein